MSDPSAPNWRYPLGEICIGEEEIARVSAVLRGGWLTQGPVCREFEQRFAGLIGIPGDQAKLVSSGTAALHLGLVGLGVGPGDEVIVPSLSFVASAACIRYVGATPVFADIIGLDEPTLDPDDVARRLTPRTRAIICVHYAGYAARMVELSALCRAHGLLLVEDAAHAPGASLLGRGLGTWGDVGCFSFFSNKNLAMGEGGLVAARDSALAERIGRLRSHGMTSETLERHQGRSFSYDVDRLGFNYRLSEPAAAIGLAQLDRLPAAAERRRRATGRYREQLAGLPDLMLPFEGSPGVSAHHILPTVLAEGLDRRRFMQALKGRGIQTSIHYPPIHLFSDYREGLGTGPGLLPRTEDYAARELTLPLHPGLGDADVDLICGAVVDALAPSGQAR